MLKMYPPQEVPNMTIPGKSTVWMKMYVFSSYHQTFQVPKIEVLTYMGCMDTAYVRENPSPKQPYKVQETLHLRYLKFLVKLVMLVFRGTITFEVSPARKFGKSNQGQAWHILSWHQGPSYKICGHWPYMKKMLGIWTIWGINLSATWPNLALAAGSMVNKGFLKYLTDSIWSIPTVADLSRRFILLDHGLFPRKFMGILANQKLSNVAMRFQPSHFLIWNHVHLPSGKLT